MVDSVREEGWLSRVAGCIQANNVGPRLDVTVHVFGRRRDLEGLAGRGVEGDLPLGEAAAGRAGRPAVDRHALDVARVGRRALDERPGCRRGRRW